MSESPPFPAAWLVNRSGGQINVQGCCLLGRSSKCNICLDADTEVSRLHACINQQNGREFWLVDYGSSNGTYLNGRRLSHPQKLRNGDRLGLGGQVLQFLQAAEPTIPDEAHTPSSTTACHVSPQTCWLLLADIVGSTQLFQQLPLAKLPKLTGQWFKTSQEIIEKYGGRINQFLGDGYFAYWLDHAQIEAEICQALLSLEQLRKDAEMDFRLVAHVGQVVLGGMVVCQEEHIAGSPVSFIFRMEKLAATLGERRLLSQAAASRLDALLPVKAIGESGLKDFPGEYPFYTF